MWVAVDPVECRSRMTMYSKFSCSYDQTLDLKRFISGLSVSGFQPCTDVAVR